MMSSAHWFSLLASDDVVCTLVQPISGQDRGGRNVTTDNFFTSVDLANQLKNKKLTLVWTLKQNKRKIPQEFKPARQRDENLSIFRSHTEAKQKKNSTRVQACQAT
jgi:hypothetical protein